MKILDLQTGRTHEYGTNGHDSLYVSPDGRYLTYYNLQNGDGSCVGDYRFVCDDDKVPAESETADARHCEVYFNIGGWNEEPKTDDTPEGTWIPEEETYTDLSGTIETYTRFKCDHCLQGQNFGPYPFCPWCGTKMNPEIRKERTT